ncbi:MAG: DUF4102 domain-containing protein [Rhodospirillaceae bacterium]|nr:DUF4102 domain-containing protein [Rhodospirillaceae bacterium]
MPKITDALAKTLVPPSSGNRVHYDSEIGGFGIRVTAAGTKAFVLNYRADGRERRYTIGKYGRVWSVEAARKRAGDLRRLVDKGEDPLGTKHAKRAAPTVGDLIDQFKSVHLPRKRPNTVKQYEAILEQRVRPALGRMKLVDVKHADIDKLHRTMSKSAPYQANRMAAVVSKMFAYAMKLQWRTDNPVKGLERNHEERRERFLSPVEIGRLTDALANLADQRSADAIRFLVLTGARKGEVLAADWIQFDLETGVWVKPSSHTKQKRIHRVPLSAPALALLVNLRAKADAAADRAREEGMSAPTSSRYLFPGDVKGSPLSTIKKSWVTATAAAGLKDVRLHDLRHTYASILASAGLSLPIIGALLGHTQAQTTMRYSHLLDDPLRAATERVGAIVGAAGRKGADIVPLKAGGR